MVAVVALIIDNYEVAQHIGEMCLWIAAVITMWSGYNYVVVGIKQID